MHVLCQLTPYLTFLSSSTSPLPLNILSPSPYPTLSIYLYPPDLLDFDLDQIVFLFLGLGDLMFMLKTVYLRERHS